MLTPGTVVDDRYEVADLLGRGGMADVFRAVDVESGEAVAVKVLRANDASTTARFDVEARALQALDHPAVVRLHAAGWHDGSPYLVLDLVAGPTLTGLLAEGPLEIDRAVAAAEQLAGALAHAHEHGVVHRDVKPSNVLFDETMQPRLADFGIARFADSTHLTATGLCVGTAAYVAPEQLEGRGGAAVDVYALGLVVVEAVTGTLCFPGTPAEAALARLHRSPVVPSTLPPWLRDLLHAMTARDPAHRPSAGDVAAAFRARSIEPLPAALRHPTSATEPLALAGGGRRRGVAATVRHVIDRAREPLPARRRLAACLTLAVVAGAAAGSGLLDGGDLHVVEQGAGAQAADAATTTTAPATTQPPPPPTTIAVVQDTTPVTEAPLPPADHHRHPSAAPDQGPAPKPPKPPKPPKNERGRGD